MAVRLLETGRLQQVALSEDLTGGSECAPKQAARSQSHQPHDLFRRRCLGGECRCPEFNSIADASRNWPRADDWISWSVPLESSSAAVFEVWVHAPVLTMVIRRLSNTWQFAKVVIGFSAICNQGGKGHGNKCCRFSTFLVGRESA